MRFFHACTYQINNKLIKVSATTNLSWLLFSCQVKEKNLFCRCWLKIRLPRQTIEKVCPQNKALLFAAINAAVNLQTARNRKLHKVTHRETCIPFASALEIQNTKKISNSFCLTLDIPTMCILLCTGYCLRIAVGRFVRRYSNLEEGLKQNVFTGWQSNFDIDNWLSWQGYGWLYGENSEVMSVIILIEKKTFKNVKEIYVIFETFVWQNYTITP